MTKSTYWEDKVYSRGKSFNKYPYDSVVSFIFNYLPKDKDRRDINILEVGCGAGNNLWFAAREGFRVTGIDGSLSAIEFAQNRFKDERLEGRFIHGDFTRLPLDDDQFDFVIDRAAITCCGWDDVEAVIGQIHRVLAPKGKFMFNAYSDRHSSYRSGEFRLDGTKTNMTEGTLKGIEQVYFFNRGAIVKLFPSSLWTMLSRRHQEITEDAGPAASMHAEWTVIVEKK